jgi:glucokinase
MTRSGGDNSLLLGFDVGGTKTVIALGQADGAVLAHERLETPQSGDPRGDLATLADRARALVAGAGARLDQVAQVGVSFPGPLDVETGIVFNPPNLPGWDRIPVRDVLQEALGCPVALENDANAAALAEWRFGAGQGTSHMLFLTMSTGVGGGLILGGRLHRGVASSAGEVGHMPVVWNGAACSCGMRGCLEAYVGGAAWTRRLAKRTPTTSRVAALAGGPERARPEHVVGAAREGDAFALAELHRFNEYLARGLVQLCFALAPELIVLGTIAAAAGEELCLGPLRERVRPHLWPIVGENLRIEATALGKRLPELAGLGVAGDRLGREDA